MASSTESNRFRYYLTQGDAVEDAQDRYVRRGYEHFAAIAAAEELIRQAFRDSGEFIDHDGVVARYTMTGYSVGEVAPEYKGDFETLRREGVNRTGERVIR